MAIRIIEESVATQDQIHIQEPDSLELLRKIPFVQHFIPPSNGVVATFPGRVTFSDLVIESDEPLDQGRTYTFVVEDTEYCGLVVEGLADAPYRYRLVMNYTKAVKVSHDEKDRD